MAALGRPHQVWVGHSLGSRLAVRPLAGVGMVALEIERGDQALLLGSGVAAQAP